MSRGESMISIGTEIHKKFETSTPWVFGIRGAAEYLGLGVSTVKRDWPSWEKLGVKVYRYKKELRFRKSDLDMVLSPVN